MQNKKILEHKSGIYLITNTINNHKYVGQSVDIKNRFERHHFCDYKNPKHLDNSQLYKAISKYGIHNFRIDILEYCEKKDLNEREIYWIAKLNTFKNGYNATLGGSNMSPKIFSKKTYEIAREKIITNKMLNGDNHPRAKLTNETVINIRQRYINGESADDIYKDFQNLYSSKECFKNIIFGKSYKDVGNVPTKDKIRYTNKNKKLGKLSDEEVRKIREEFKSMTLSEIARKHKLSVPTISGIVKRKYYKFVD